MVYPTRNLHAGDLEKGLIKCHLHFANFSPINPINFVFFIFPVNSPSKIHSINSILILRASKANKKRVLLVYPSKINFSETLQTLFYQYFNSSYSSNLDNNATISQCTVCGKRSTGCTFLSSYPKSLSHTMSSANVSGLHDT